MIETPTPVTSSLLYLDDVSVSFDGFKAINGLSLPSSRAKCGPLSAQMAQAKPP